MNFPRYIVFVSTQEMMALKTCSLRNLAHAIYRDFFSVVKKLKFHQKIFDIFLIFAQNIDCGGTLEPPW